MTTKVRFGIAAIVLAAMFALVYTSGPSFAGGEKDLQKTVKSIAADFKDGKAEAAKAKAVKAAKGIEETSDLMHMFRPTTKGGLGLEKSLKTPAVKDAAELGNLAAAMAELTIAKGWAKDQGKKTKKAWNESAEGMRAAGLELARATDAKGVKTAATKVNNSCVGCHAIFKE